MEPVQIGLTNGGFTLVDAEDAEWVQRWGWHQQEKGYVARYTRKQERVDGMPKLVFLHRELLAAPSEVHIHHWNEDKLDNRKHNLDPMAPATHSREHGRRREEQGVGARGVNAFGGDRSRGIRRPCAKLTEEQAVFAMARMLVGESKTSIARDYGVSECPIRAIWNGTGWAHLFQQTAD